MSFLVWLGLKKNIDRNKTTEKFEKYKRKRMKENKKNGLWESDENLLLRFTLGTFESPFEGDDEFKEAWRFLKENEVMVN